MQNNWMRTFEIIDRHVTSFAFGDQSLAGIKPCQIMQETGGTRCLRIGSVQSCEFFGEFGNPQRVPEPVFLLDVLTNAFFSRHAVGKACCSIRSRLRYNSP